MAGLFSVTSTFVFTTNNSPLKICSMHSYNHKSFRQTVDDKALCPLVDKQNKTEGYKNGNENSNCVSISKLKVQALC